MTGAYLTDDEADPIKPAAEQDYTAEMDRADAIKKAIDLMSVAAFAPLLNSAILPNLEHIANQIYNYVKTGSMNPKE